MEDRYLDLSKCVSRLIDDYKKHGILYVAFDFDNTVYDFHQVGDTYPKIEALLQHLKQIGFKLILFTASKDDRLTETLKYCKDHGYNPDYVNCSPVMHTTKPYFNILLDDRAGLQTAYWTLVQTLKYLNL